MNVLDENVSVIQQQLLKSWRISIRHIGYDLGRKGMTDKEIIPFLLTLRRPTFSRWMGTFTHLPFAMPDTAWCSWIPAGRNALTLFADLWDTLCLILRPNEWAQSSVFRTLACWSGGCTHKLSCPSDGSKAETRLVGETLGTGANKDAYRSFPS